MVRPTSATICGASPSDGSSISSTRGLRHQRAADRQHLLLAAGERGRQAGGGARQPREHREHACRPSTASCRRRRGLARRDAQVLAHGEAAEHAPALRHQRDAARRRSARAQAVVTGVPNTSTLPRARRQQADGDVHAGRLAGAVAAEEAEQPALAERERDAAAARGCRRRRRRRRRALSALRRQGRPPACADRPTTSARVPSTITSPKCRSVMRSAKSSATSMSCSIMTMVTSRGMAASSFCTSRRSSTERPANGSSSSSTFGFCASAMAISTRRRSP